MTSLGLGACTKAPDANNITFGGDVRTLVSPSTNTGTTSASTLSQEGIPTSFTETRALYTRIVQKRKTYTYGPSDVPPNHDENEFKKEANWEHKTIKNFAKYTAMIVEKYASSPYMNQLDREQTIKTSVDSEQTGVAIISILKDVYGTQSPKIDFSKIEETVCKYSESDWNSFFTELHTALVAHKKVVKSNKEDKRYLVTLLDLDIWRLIKRAEESDSIDAQVLKYLKREQCNLPKTPSPNVPATPTTAPTSNDIKANRGDDRVEDQSLQNPDYNKIVDDQALAPPAGQPLGVRYYSPEQLENLPAVDTTAPNVGTIDPNMELQYTH